MRSLGTRAAMKIEAVRKAPPPRTRGIHRTRFEDEGYHEETLTQSNTQAIHGSGSG